MMGMIQPSMVVTRSDRRGKGKNVQPGNREWATAITCISADGFDAPPFILVQGQPPRQLIHPGRYAGFLGFKPTSNGWTDNETGLDWIKHFNKHTKDRRHGS